MKTGKKIILVVEQSMVVLERMMPMLEELSNVEFVVHAGNYKEAMGMLGQVRPHMLLMDIDLPDQRGIDLVRMVRKEYGHIIVFIVTNFVSEQHRYAFQQLGARFFDKSADYECVKEAVAAL